MIPYPVFDSMIQISPEKKKMLEIIILFILDKNNTMIVKLEQNAGNIWLSTQIDGQHLRLLLLLS